jgi:hypothetical protein
MSPSINEISIAHTQFAFAVPVDVSLNVSSASAASHKTSGSSLYHAIIAYRQAQLKAHPRVFFLQTELPNLLQLHHSKILTIAFKTSERSSFRTATAKAIEKLFHGIPISSNHIWETIHSLSSCFHIYCLKVRQKQSFGSNRIRIIFIFRFKNKQENKKNREFVTNSSYKKKTCQSVDFCCPETKRILRMKDKESEMFEQQRENSFNNGIID